MNYISNETEHYIFTSVQWRTPMQNLLKTSTLILITVSLLFAKDSTIVRLKKILRNTSKENLLQSTAFILNDASYCNNRYFQIISAKGEQGIIFADIMAASGFAFTFLMHGDTIYSPDDPTHREPLTEYADNDDRSMFVMFLKTIKLFYDGNKRHIKKEYKLKIPPINDSTWKVEAIPRSSDIGNVHKVVLMGAENIDSVLVFTKNKQHTFTLAPYEYGKKLTKEGKKMFRPYMWEEVEE